GGKRPPSRTTDGVLDELNVAVGHRHIDAARVGTRGGHSPARIGVATDAATLVLKSAPVENRFIGKLGEIDHRGTRDAHDPTIATVIGDATWHCRSKTGCAGLNVGYHLGKGIRYRTDVVDVATDRSTARLEEDEIAAILRAISSVRTASIITVAPRPGEVLGE